VTWEKLLSGSPVRLTVGFADTDMPWVVSLLILKLFKERWLVLSPLAGAFDFALAVEAAIAFKFTISRQSSC